MPWLSISSAVFSVMTGEMMTSYGSRIARLLALLGRGRLGRSVSAEPVDRRALDDDRVGPQHVVDRLLAERHDLHARQIPRGEVEQLVHAVGQEQHLAVQLERLQ